MKRVLGIALALGLVAAMAVPATATPAERYDVSDRMVAACGDDPSDVVIVVGSGFAVVNDNVWTKVMKATVPENCVLSHAVVQNAENAYDGTCNLSGVGSTYEWQTVTTPNGSAKQVCQGVIE